MTKRLGDIMKAAIPTRNTASCSSSDAPRCRCGRLLNIADTICRHCCDRAARADFWAGVEGLELLEAAESIGVHRRFCRHSRLPTFDDNGLRERIAAHPLPLAVCWSAARPTATKHTYCPRAPVTPPGAASGR